MKLRKVRGK